MGSRYWIGTIPTSLSWSPSPNPELVVWARGQQEVGANGLEHWQVVLGLKSQQRLSWVRKWYPGHWEPTRSSAADEYVWKDDTAVAGTRFEIGSKPSNRNSPTDWASVLATAKSGSLDGIPPDIVVRCYRSLRQIGGDFVQPVAQVRTCEVFWGTSGTGKSRRAWEEAGVAAYSKDPATKWFDGYDGQEHLVLDEFRGQIGIAHLLRWLDRYPVRVETKGGSRPLMVTKFWITSNLSPEQWYPDLDEETLIALRRRINITHFA